MFNRTFHPDEANQAFTLGRLLDTGVYRYDPADHHGPTLYYAAAPLQRAFGHTSTATLSPDLLRTTPLLFAILSLFLVFLALRKSFNSTSPSGALGRRIVPSALLLLATAPFFVFFAIDFIQEMLLACFLLGMFAAARFRQPWWFGLAAGLACATKETCVLSFAAAGISHLIVFRQKPNWDKCILATLVAALAAITLYSAFCADWSGVCRACVSAPLSYFNRAAGDTATAAWHVHPWYQYAQWLFTSNWRFTALPTLFLFILTFSRRSFLHVYVLLLFALYSVLPYKTPWCALQLIIPLTLAPFFTPGRPLSSPLTNARARQLANALILLQLALNFVAISFMFAHPDSDAIPCNYAHSSPEVKELAARVEQKLAAAPDSFAAVALPASDTWPLPFYLRAVADRVGYWTSTSELLAATAQTRKTPRTPAAVIVPMEDGHLAQPLFPSLRETSRHAIRPGIRARLFR